MSSSFRRVLALANLAVSKTFAAAADLKAARASKNAKAPKQRDAKPKFKNTKTTYRKDDASTHYLRRRDRDYWIRWGFRSWRSVNYASAAVQRDTVARAQLKREWRQLRNLNQHTVPCHVYVARGLEA